ncbi:helix-turn-helix transcriptional regulator [Actinomadura sp. KC216]|uniref:helix-turn-helix transcriptional regulator n=1 Tax=Actinomadura sp. KC216 TaxID=2530370 RepID=UPI00104840EA|nr:helix-turn-helix transcriptional regulator [Actinomadura sp. KC216]TDB88743.1 helix-turn-helix transcriptional regulator [Actinomadura sp. KC216]
MTRSLDGLLDELRTASGLGAGADEMGAALHGVIRRRVAHDALRVVVTNPAAGLMLGSLSSCWHRYEPEFVSALVLDRFAGGDPCRPEDLARRPLPVGVVDRRGDLPRQRRTRQLLQTHGAGSELRLLLRDRRGTWGFVGLARAEGGTPFGTRDVERAAQLGPGLVSILRGFATGQPLASRAPASPAGVITIGRDHTIRAISPEARTWLAHLRRPWWNTAPDEIPARFVAELSLDTRERVRDGRPREQQLYASYLDPGRRIAVRGQPLGDDVAIVIQAAVGDLLLPSFCHWHQITRREREMIEHVRTGEPPKRIARVMNISAHTVNEHLKSIYRKTGADGRDELFAALTH